MTAPRDERIAQLEGAIERIMIGGNHLASALIHWLGAGEATFPSYSCTAEYAQAVIPDTLHWDAWVCWQQIMQARDSLTPKPDAAPPTCKECLQVPPLFGSSAADEMEAFARWVRSGHYNADDARDEIARAAENRVRELRTQAKSAPPKEGERALRGEEKS